ncbi:hypothetical protein D9C73_017214 [Collichthys lucidus]|uniref:Uncharacterized protein n=1 Tax=Collichthys lucidus TaxID=240159 RepID=A0A4U5V5E1_COLLU|nr:hypothetical protein D9C73_017214 [Collichthys lucidus]
MKMTRAMETSFKLALKKPPSLRTAETDNKSYRGDLWRFRLCPVQIGHLWEFQPSQSRRLPREAEPATSRTEEEMQTSVWSTLYSWSVRRERRLKRVCVCVCASAEVTRGGGLLSADAAQRIKVKGQHWCLSARLPIFFNQFMVTSAHSQQHRHSCQKKYTADDKSGTDDESVQVQDEDLNARPSDPIGTDCCHFHHGLLTSTDVLVAMFAACVVTFGNICDPKKAIVSQHLQAEAFLPVKSL